MKLVKAFGIIALVVLAGLGYAVWSARQWPGDRGMMERLRERTATDSGVLDLTSITPFHWTRLEIFGPYSSRGEAERRLGFEWAYKWSAVEYRDDIDFLVFVDSNRVAAAFELPHSTAVVSAPDSRVLRDAARFVSDHGTLKSIEPIFESDLWPGEGIPVIQAQRDTLVLFAEPRLGPKPIGRRVTRRGERIRFDSTRFVTLAPVSAVEAPDSIRGRWFGQIRRVRLDEYYGGGRDTTMATSGRFPLLLQPRAEGECFIRIGRDVLAANCPRVPNYPGTMWWAWTPGPGGAGWFVVNDSTAKVTARRF